MDGDILQRLPTTEPMALEQRQTGYRQFGANVAQWDPEAQIRWLAAQGEGQWEQYVDPRTMRDYRERFVPAGQAQQLADLQQQQQQQQQQYLPLLGPEETAWCSRTHGNDPLRWPGPLRSRWLRDLGPRTQLAGGYGDGGNLQNDPAPVWPPPTHGPCGFCLTTGRHDSCNINMDVGIGCTACRDGNMECVAPHGLSLATRPPQDVRSLSLMPRATLPTSITMFEDTLCAGAPPHAQIRTIFSQDTPGCDPDTRHLFQFIPWINSFANAKSL